MKYRLLRFSLLCMLVMLCGGSVWAQDVTYDLTDGSWSVSNGKLTNGTVEFSGEGGANFKMNGGYFMMGKNGAYINFPIYDKAVTKIVVTGNSAASGSVKQNIFVGEKTVSTETTGATGTNTYEIASDYQAAGTQYTLKVTSNHNTQITKIEVYFEDASDTRTQTVLLFDGEYQTTGEVGGSMELPTTLVKTVVDGVQTGTLNEPTITWESSNTAVATIDGNIISFVGVGKSTITASYAGNETQYKPSSNSFELTVSEAPYTSLQALQEAATGTSTPVTIQFNNVFVTAVKGSNAYLADADGYGALIYTSGHGLEAGNVLNGTVNANLVLFKGQAEITGFSKDGLTITTTELTPTVKTIDAITAANQSTLVTLKGVTYNAEAGTLSDGENTIKYYDNFNASPILEDGKTYDVTGIVVVFNTTIEICPRTADDVVEATPAITVAKPVISGGFPTFYTEKTVAITCETEGATIYYTTDGSVPTAESTLYSGPFTINASCTIKAIAIIDNVSSEVAETAFIKYAIHDRYIVVGDENTPLTTDENFKMTFNEETEAYEYTLATTAATTSFRITTKTENNTLTPVSIDDESYNGTVELDEEYGLGANNTYPTINIAGSGIYLISVYDPGSIIITKTGDLSPFYILGVNDANENDAWDIPAEFVEMTWDTENEVYTYELNNTTNAFFCFSTNNEVSDWDTFNSTYRWATAEGDQEYNLNLLDTPLQLQKVNGTIVLPAGEWTISVTADKIMTITGEATPITPTEAQYYVVGSMTNWAVDEAYKMSVNEESETPEYSFTMDLNTDDQFKVVKVEEGKDNVWYPDGEGNAYGENGEIPADGEYTIYFRPNGDGGDDWFYNLIYAAFNGEPVVGFRDIKVTLNDADMWQDKINSSGAASTVYITVDAEGNIGTTENADEAAATLKGYWHSAQYGWQKFSAEVPVEGCVKITLGASNYGTGAVIVTNSDGDQVAKIDNHTGAMWSTNSPDNVAVGYYRINEPTTLTFSECDYIPYFAVEAIDEADLPAEVTNYNVTFAAGEGVEGVAPAAVEVEAGNKITAPANYTLYKDGSTLTGWSDGETTYAPGDEITPATDMQLTAVFTENTVNLVDRTEAVTITFPLNGYNNNPQHKLNNGGIIVTQVTVGESSIDVKADVTGSLVANGSGWHLASNSCAISVPSCKGASMTVTTYSDPSNAIKFENNAPKSVTGTENPYTASYETASTDATLAIDAASDIYISNIAITLPVVSGDEPVSGTIFSADVIATAAQSFANGETEISDEQATIVGGKMYAISGQTDAKNLINKQSDIYYFCMTNNNTYFKVELDNALAVGDLITAKGNGGVKNNLQKGLWVSTSESYPAAAPACAGTSESEIIIDNLLSYTVEEGDEYVGKKILYIFRAAGATQYFDEFTITRPVIDPNFVATPVITPATGTYASEKEVTITCETEDANIYYTLDGTDPTSQSTAYNDAFTVTETTTVKAIAIKGDNSSEIAESVITIINIQPGESNLEWDYTDKNIPEEKEDADPMYEDNGLFYASFVNDKTDVLEQYNRMNGVKLNSSGKAWFAKNPVAGKLTLTFGLRDGAGAYSVNVYSCTIDGNTATQGELIKTVSVSESPGTASIDIPEGITGIYLTRGTSKEGVISKIVFKETVPRTFQSFEITNEQLKGTIADMNLPEGVTLTGTQPAANNNAHGYSGATIVVPTDGGAVKFTIGGCQYNNGTFTVKNSNNETLATLSNKTTKCYHQDGSVVTYFYTGEATTLTFSTIENLPYFKAEAVDVEEVTITYKDQNGEVLGTKKVIEGSAIGEAPYTEADLTIAEGYAFRGWIYTNGVKVKATDTVDGNKTVMASVTAIEEAPTTGSIQVYDLTQSTFYPEDHENFDVNGGSFHDGQHGFSFGNGQSFSVKVSSKAQVVVTLCQHSNEGTVTVKDANNNPVGEGFNAKVASCGETAVVKYEGEATTLTFTFAATAYIHDVKVFNVNEFPEKDEATGYYMVPAGDAVALVLAINSASAEANSKIFLPNATYDLGELVKTTISGTNVSIIGESMDGVIIKTTPDVSIEGLDKADMFQNSGTGLYLQDLTLQNAMEYTGNTGRAAVLQDKGTQTIYKNVKMLSHQDTYYSHKTDGEYYFEDCEIHGTVDYVCGTGDVFFNKTLFYNEYRSSGDCIAAPNQKKQFGYIFNDCTIDGDEGQDGKYRLARPWAAGAQAIFINTTMNIKPVAAGWDDWSPANAVSRFAEYNSVDANGDAIDLSSRKNSFNGVANNPVLSEEEAANYTLDKVFTSWAPNEVAAQVEAPAATLDGNTISWTAVEGATAYAVYDGETLLGITTGTTWITDGAVGAPRRAESTETSYSIRAANSRGGFGKAKIVSGEADGITNINAEQNGDVKIYDLQGRQVKTATKGVYIINGKKTIFK